MSSIHAPAPLLEVSGLSKTFVTANGRLQAVNGVDFSLFEGEALGLVGESGSGKSTIGRLVLRLLEPSAGHIRFAGTDLGTLQAEPMRRLRRDVQVVFQDPWAALNPRLTIGYQIEEPLRLHTDLGPAERRARIAEIVERTRLSAALLARYPADLSGGQLQRVCIARALVTRPKLIVLDEPTSSLDLSVRAGILELLGELKRDLGVATLFISHDLGTIKLVCDRVMVLYLGTVVETGTAAELFANPRHPYTQALISAHLSPDPRERRQRIMLKGEIPSPVNLPKGCVFASRCPVMIEACGAHQPPLHALTHPPTHAVACLRAGDNLSALMGVSP